MNGLYAHLHKECTIWCAPELGVHSELLFTPEYVSDEDVMQMIGKQRHILKLLPIREGTLEDYKHLLCNPHPLNVRGRIMVRVTSLLNENNKVIEDNTAEFSKERYAEYLATKIAPYMKGKGR